MIYIDTKEWLEGKQYGIGGSEAGIVLGLNPWKSRLELWDEKVNKTRHLDPDAEIRLELGNILEPFIAEQYSKKTGRRLEIREQRFHPVYRFILGNVDREILDDGRGPGILEIKTKGAFSDWEGEIPIYYQAQLQHYLNIYNYTWGSFAVLDLGRMDINIKDIERDDEFISKLVKEEIEFWNLVEKKIPPAVDSSKACQEFLREKYKVSEEISIDLKNNEEARKWAIMLREAKRNIKAFDIMETDAKNHLMSIVGNAERAIGDGWTITWKAPKDKEILDLENFKRDYPEIAKKYIKYESQQRRFMVRFTENKQLKIGKVGSSKKDNKGKEEKEAIKIDNSGLNTIKKMLCEE